MSGPGSGTGVDEIAYVELVERHRAELWAHCRRMLGSAHDAEDALQDALLRAWMSRDQFEGRGSVRGWLYRIATNAALEILRRRPGQVVPLVDEPRSGQVETDPEDRYERREALEHALVTADRALTGKQRAVVILREVLGFSAKETAKRLDMSVAAVNSALQRARAALETRATRPA